MYVSKQVSSLGIKLPNYTHALTRRSCATPRGAASPSATGAISRSRYTCRRRRRSPPNVRQMLAALRSPPYPPPRAECLTVSFLWTRELSPRRTQTYTQRDSNPNPNPNPIPGPYPHPHPPSNHNPNPNPNQAGWCHTADGGASYRGTASTTVTGRTCRRSEALTLYPSPSPSPTHKPSLIPSPGPIR